MLVHHTIPMWQVWLENRLSMRIYSICLSLQTSVPLQVERPFSNSSFCWCLARNMEKKEGASRFLLRILCSAKFCWHLGQLPYSPDILLYYLQITQHIGVANSPVSEKHISRAANDPSVFTISEKAPTRACSWLKAPTSALTFKTLLRHYAKQA